MLDRIFGARRKRQVGVLTCAAFLVMVSGCATMIHGTSQTVPLGVTPTGSKVSVYRWNGELVTEGTSPAQLSIRRPKGNQSYLVKVTSDGYCPRYALTRNGTTPVAMFEQIWFLVTLGVIWLIPVAIDNSTGAAYRVETAPFDGGLEEAASCNG